jgi:hypothetical protein
MVLSPFNTIRKAAVILSDTVKEEGPDPVLLLLISNDLWA